MARPFALTHALRPFSACLDARTPAGSSWGAHAWRAREFVLILDFGAQYTQLIARRVREQRVYCEIHPCTVSFDAIRALAPRAIILSGGPASVYGEGAPDVDARVFELGVPVLGICYGLQLIAHLLGGKVERGRGRANTATRRSSSRRTRASSTASPSARRSTCGCRHGDRIAALPAGFQTIGVSGNTPFCAVGNAERRIYGVQFHPEVVHTPRGSDDPRRVPLRRRRPRADLDRRARSPRRPSPRVRAKVGADRPRHLRALGRRRLLGRRDALPHGARRAAHVHLRRQRPPAPGRGRAGGAPRSARAST